MRKELFKTCPNNEWVRCSNRTDKGCENCGWNPCVAEERMEAIRRALMPAEMKMEAAEA